MPRGDNTQWFGRDKPPPKSPGRNRLPDAIREFRRTYKPTVYEYFKRFALMPTQDLFEFYKSKDGTVVETYIASLWYHAIMEGDPVRGEKALYPLIGELRPPPTPSVAIQINEAPNMLQMLNETNQLAYAEICKLKEKAQQQELSKEEISSLVILQKSLVDANVAGEQSLTQQRLIASRMSTDELKERLKKALNE